MLCDGRPDPTCKKDINTFINLTREDDSNKDIGKVLKKCELILEVIFEQVIFGRYLLIFFQLKKKILLILVVVLFLS